jgi:hypothetical protein
MSDEITIPRFKGWTKPATVLEALERSLAHARMEDKWCSGEWFDTNLHNFIHVEYNDRPTPKSLAIIAGQIEGMVCTDVKACAAGIVAIEVLDGEALFSYYNNNEKLSQNLLMGNPIFRGAIEMLAQALTQTFITSEEDDSPTIPSQEDPINRVIWLNDGPVDDGSEYSADKHHAYIVKGFERAVELAKEAQV